MEDVVTSAAAAAAESDEDEGTPKRPKFRTSILSSSQISSPVWLITRVTKITDISR